MFLLQNQEIERCLKYKPKHLFNTDLISTYNKIKEFLNKYTLYMSDFLNSDLSPYDTPERMLDMCDDINKFTIGYCVLFNKKE